MRTIFLPKLLLTSKVVVGCGVTVLVCRERTAITFMVELCDTCIKDIFNKVA